jgi:hypothetical protein
LCVCSRNGDGEQQRDDSFQTQTSGEGAAHEG